MSEKVYWGRCEGKPDSFYNMHESGTVKHNKSIAKNLNEYIDICLGKIPEGFEILCSETQTGYTCRFRKNTKQGISYRNKKGE